MATSSLLSFLRSIRSSCAYARRRPFFRCLHISDPVWRGAHRLPGALKERLEKIADEYTESVLLGTGQFCTNPGIVIVQVTTTLAASTDTLATANTAKTQPVARILRHSFHPKCVIDSTRVDRLETMQRN